MPQTAFIVRPFGRKPFVYPAKLAPMVASLLRAQEGHAAEQCLVFAESSTPAPARQANGVAGSATAAAAPVIPSGAGEVQVDFDALERTLIKPALAAARIRGDTTGAVVEAGNIREDMFNRLITADLVVADVSLHNPNVFYELGLRQAFRDKFTFVIRCDLNAYPFDLQTDRYFEYRLLDLLRDPQAVVLSLATALRKTMNQYRADSPVFKLMPQLEAEDRSRFLSVPEDFREEVERARRQRQRESLDLLALECEEHLWEIEGLRVVGRAQFDANFIEGAKDTWQRIAARYPDDAEANTVLSTVYQRLQDRTRSEQALARVTRSRTLSPARLSELRSLNGRNLKAAWTDQWQTQDNMPLQQRRLEALRSPLLQGAIDAYLDAFKIDLNNSYAGLNALTLQVIQTELIDGHLDEWRRLLRHTDDERREYETRVERIDQLVHALRLALESDRDRLASHGPGDPWFSMLEAAVECTVSRQPDYVAQLYVQARWYAPPKSDAAMMAALDMYGQLGIEGRFAAPYWRKPQCVGTLGDNVRAALKALRSGEDGAAKAERPQRIIVFVGMRVDEGRRALADASVPSTQAPAPSPTQRASDAAAGDADCAPIFPSSAEAEVRRLIEQAVIEELGGTEAMSRLDGAPPKALALAGGASGGDLLFQEICAQLQVPAQMFLALPKPQHIGEYVAPAGGHWVSRFNEVYRRLNLERPDLPLGSLLALNGVKVFSDTTDLPRWLQDRDHYNVGRRSMLWMIQHAKNLAQAIGSDVEVSLIALRSPDTPAAKDFAFGGVRFAIRLAQMHGVNVRQIEMPAVAAPASTAVAPGAAMPSAVVPGRLVSEGVGAALQAIEPLIAGSAGGGQAAAEPGADAGASGNGRPGTGAGRPAPHR